MMVVGKEVIRNASTTYHIQVRTSSRTYVVRDTGDTNFYYVYPYLCKNFSLYS